MTHILYRHGGKRLLDVVIAAPSLILAAPLMLVIAIAVRLRLGAPVIFRQKRPGKGGLPFTLLKFRTMRDATDESGSALPDHLRLTRFGQLLRSTSLDELPELWNVVRGDMSLVGPRPLLMEYLPLYSAEQSRRHEVRPGITGLAQVSGRNELPWPDRLRTDVHYVDHHSLSLDLKILALTIRKVVAREGISQHGEATARRFEGET